jgi:hypothetical protein
MQFLTKTIQQEFKDPFYKQHAKLFDSNYKEGIQKFIDP